MGKFKVLEKGKKVYKKVYYWSNEYRFSAIAALWLPEGTQVYESQSKKCRASSAYVLEITPMQLDGTLSIKDGVYYSGHHRDFLYKAGKVVKPKRGFSKVNETCESGIHYYRDRASAVKH